jgi:hypothetical protein
MKNGKNSQEPQFKTVYASQVALALDSALCHAMRMEKKPPAPDPNSKFAEVKRKAAELRAKKQSAREEQNRRAEQIPRELDEGEES